ncbi:transmembrane amino acid transporter protein-domain-containing protein [Coniella lustricola]|uniref:Transmembrane amino acid transporter protein-domain-containing protein n=1 Tax=Coniella lustricola TaxID=2025994 RepID=A0A2T3A8R9_9PEZI|nr:transmembrane amino acid transporter protein-domain-containing protein [Coniella lustricola]
MREKSTTSLGVDGSSDVSATPEKQAGDGSPPEYAGTTSSLAREEGEEINYHTLSWWRAAVVLVAETVSLGILSLPSVIATLGLVPGIIVICVIAVISGYSGLVFGHFCQQYPDIRSFGDAGAIMGEALWGPAAGRACFLLLGWGQTVFMVFIMGSHLLTWSIALNNLTDSSQCTVMWTGIGLIIFFLFNIGRTLEYTSYMSIASSLSILSAVLVTIVDVAVEKPIGSTSIDIFRQMGFTTGFLATTNIAIAFCAHSCFFTVMSELKNKADWPKALCALQILDTSLYLVSAIVIYIFVGPDVPSPALSAAGSDVLRKVIWGIALPTIVIAGVIYGHVAGTFMFERVFGGTEHVVRRTRLGTIAWLSMMLGIWLLAFVIAESIPIFNSLLSLVAALFVSWFSYGIPGMMWLFLYRHEYSQRKVGVVANIGLVIIGFLLCAVGLWSTIDSLAGSSSSKPWTCASNA